MPRSAAEVTDREAWEMAERMNAKAPEGVRYEIRRTNTPVTGERPPRQARLGEEVYEPVTPWYVARVVTERVRTSGFGTT
jgi:hypothetical protein